ncbi:MAG: DUF6142 family protein [Lachnospiraceae bacterium]|jgi:multisubunit Na+/H+ antiporter MnhB subunit|nr:DUF6142 family protein [Lachnospiraceae bacterium]
MKRKSNLVFTNKRHSEKAIFSTILGIISFFSLSYVCFLAYQAGGEAKIGYGLTGLLALAFSVVGLTLAIRSLRERDQYRFFPCMGIVWNTLSLLLICLILYFAAYVW